MTRSVFDGTSRDEQFYARALSILVGPSRGVVLLMGGLNILYWLAVIMALGWLASQAIDRRPPVVVRSVTLLTPRLVAGDPVRVSYDITRERTCETDLNWAVFDGAQEIHHFGPVHVEAPGSPARESFVRAWATPADAAPGHGRLRVVLAFQCPGNYLQALYPVTLVLPDLAIEIATPR